MFHYVYMCSSITVVSCFSPTLCNPMDCGPPGSPVHGILQARTLEWVVVPSSFQYCCCSVTQSCLTLCDPMDCSTASLSFTISQRLLKLMSIESMMPFQLYIPVQLHAYNSPCIYITFSLFIHLFTALRLLPYLGYCE